MSRDDEAEAEAAEAEEQRGALAERWEQAAAGWGRQADATRRAGMPVSTWMIDHLQLQRGQRVLELAAGPGDTGFLAAELIAPGRLVSSDASEAMLEVAAARARDQGIENVDFTRLQLEWIDEPAASFDAVLCRWGIMLCLDPAAALGECRRILRPGGRVALAVWDIPAANPWSTIPDEAAEALGGSGLAAVGPGMFSLADADRLEGLLADAGFLEVVVEPVTITREYPDVEAWLEEFLDCSQRFAAAWRRFDARQRASFQAEVTERSRPFRSSSGELGVPGRVLCAVADA